jgi:hypothetical protein
VRIIKNYYEYEIDGKDVIILSKNYNGRPSFYHKYDVLIGPKETIERFKDDLFPKINLDHGWIPKVVYI